jgi:hypothetical protein
VNYLQAPGRCGERTLSRRGVRPGASRDLVVLRHVRPFDLPSEPYQTARKPRTAAGHSAGYRCGGRRSKEMRRNPMPGRGLGSRSRARRVPPVEACACSRALRRSDVDHPAEACKACAHPPTLLFMRAGALLASYWLAASGRLCVLVVPRSQQLTPFLRRHRPQFLHELRLCDRLLRLAVHPDVHASMARSVSASVPLSMMRPDALR